MKKIFILTAITVLISLCNANAQLKKDDSVINVGLGIGSYLTTGSGFKTTLPAIEGGYERFLSENFSIGGFLGLYSSEMNIKQHLPGGGYARMNAKYSYFFIGASGNYHFVNTAKFNAYIGGKLGYVNAKVTVKEDNDFSEDMSGSVKGSGVLFTANLGARYFVSDAIAINAELGYGIAPIKIGVSFKL